MKKELTYIFLTVLSVTYGKYALAQSSNAEFSTTISESCNIYITQVGSLGLSSKGTTLSSTEAGGSPGSASIICTGERATLTVEAPPVSAPFESSTADVTLTRTNNGGGQKQFNLTATNETPYTISNSFGAKRRATYELKADLTLTTSNNQLIPAGKYIFNVGITATPR